MAKAKRMYMIIWDILLISTAVLLFLLHAGHGVLFEAQGKRLFIPVSVLLLTAGTVGIVNRIRRK